MRLLRTIFTFPTLQISVVCCYLTACSATEGESSDTEEKQQTAFERYPEEVITEGDISLEIYDFENFEPFLYRTDDKVHLINFWATWCKPCVAELPFFEELGAAHPEVEITLVSLDFRKAVQSDVIPFLKENELESEVIMLHEPDANSWVDKVDDSWSGAIPATVIYRNDNRKFYEQSFTFEELETAVNKIKQ